MVLFGKQQDLSEPVSFDLSGTKRDWDVLLGAGNEHILNQNFI